MKTLTLICFLIFAGLTFAQPKTKTLADEFLKGAVKEFTREAYFVQVKRKKIVRLENNLYDGSFSKYAYDKKGRLTYYSILNKDTTSRYGYVISYGKNDLNQIVSKFNTNRNTTSRDCTVVSNNGHLIQKFFFYNYGPFLEREWLYNKEGKILREAHYDINPDFHHYNFYIYPGGNDSIVRQTKIVDMGASKFYLDSLDRTIKIKKLNADETVRETITYEYNDRGLISKSTSKFHNGERPNITYRGFGQTVLYTYDSAGNEIKYEAYDENDNLTYQANSQYNKGRIMTTTILEDRFSDSLSLYEKIEFTYDQNGNQLSQTIQYGFNKHLFKRTLDKFGNWIKEETYNNGLIQSITERKITYYED